MSKITNDGLIRSGRQRMLYSCTHMATVGFKELNLVFCRLWAVGACCPETLCEVHEETSYLYKSYYASRTFVCHVVGSAAVRLRHGLWTFCRQKSYICWYYDRELLEPCNLPVRFTGVPHT